MSTHHSSLVDVNAALGPWPHGNAPALDVAALVDWLDRLGVARALVHHTVAHYYDAAIGNERLLREIQAEPRLLPSFVLGPLETGEFGPADTLADRLGAANVRGVRVFPHDHGWELAGEESRLLFDVLEHADLPVLVDLEQTSWGDVSAIATRHPGLALVVCSVGYRSLRTLLPLLERHHRLHCDLSYFAAHQGVEVIVERFGAERLLFGTGMPTCEPAGALACLAWADVTPESRKAIGHENAERLFRLDPPDSAAAQTRIATFQSAAQAALDTLKDGEPLDSLDVFDAHGHLGAWHAFWLPKPGLPSLLHATDRCGIDTIALSSLLAVGPDAATGNEELLAASASSDGRVVIYLVANPHLPELASTLEQQLTLPAVVGLKIHPDTHTCRADDPAYDWIWELAERTASPVLAHTFADTPWSDPLLFDDVAERFPGVRVVLAHAGVTPVGFRRAIDVCRRHSTLFVDTCGSYMTGAWIRTLVDEIGADRVLYGSDAPFIDMRYGLGRIIGAGLDDDALRLVLAGNARSLLGVPRPLTTATH